MKHPFQKWGSMQLLTMVQSCYAVLIPGCVSRESFHYSHRNQRYFRFMWSTPLESRHWHVLLEALKSLASLFQKGRFPVKQMEPITGGASPGYYRSLHGWGEIGLKKSLCLFFTSFFPILKTPCHWLWKLQWWVRPHCMFVRASGI